MKKTITLLLALVMILSLCACSGSGSGEEATPDQGLQIGYSKINITPDFQVGLDGYADAATRKSEGLMTYVFMTCIAATEGDETVLLYTYDSISCPPKRAAALREVISPATGVPADKIFFGATHSHSAPSTGEKKYTEMMMEFAVQAAQEALADRSPATIQAATPTIEGMNFVRHVVMPDGSIAGSNFGNWDLKPVGMQSEPDDQMVLVKFDRGADKKDVLMVNWQAHPDWASSIGYNMIAASWIGPFRDELEKLCGMHVAYFTGASGNLNPNSKVESLDHGLTWDQYGIKLAQLANERLPELKAVEGTGIATASQIYAVEVDHSWDHMLDQAKEVYNLWKKSSKAEGDALGKTYGFTSSYQARDIITRAKMDKTLDIELNAFRIGGVGFATTYNEMFCQQGMFIKENDPFDVTFIIAANDRYLSAAEAFEYRAYEADTGLYAKGAAEKVGEELVRLLDTVK